jgi:Cysteine-rich CPXCG
MNLEDNENFFCPHCGVPNNLYVDLTGGSRQEFVVDCEVCCSPILVRISVRGGEIVSVSVRKENE